MERCKSCGQIIQPKGLPEGVKVTGVKRRLWEAIQRWPGMSQQELMSWVYGHDRNGGPESINSIAVNVCQLNRKLRQHGIEIRGHRDEGYKVREI